MINMNMNTNMEMNSTGRWGLCASVPGHHRPCHTVQDSACQDWICNQVALYSSRSYPYFSFLGRMPLFNHGIIMQCNDRRTSQSSKWFSIVLPWRKCEDAEFSFTFQNQNQLLSALRSIYPLLRFFNNFCNMIKFLIYSGLSILSSQGYLRYADILVSTYYYMICIQPLLLAIWYYWALILSK